MEKPSESQSEPKHYRITVGGTVSAQGSTIPSADPLPEARIEVEPSATRKWLPTRNGAIACEHRVFVTIDGKTREITLDRDPDTPSASA